MSHIVENTFLTNYTSCILLKEKKKLQQYVLLYEHRRVHSNMSNVTDALDTIQIVASLHSTTPIRPPT